MELELNQGVFSDLILRILNLVLGAPASSELALIRGGLAWVLMSLRLLLPEHVKRLGLIDGDTISTEIPLVQLNR